MIKQLQLIALFAFCACTFTGTSKNIKLHHKEHSVNLGSSFYLIYPKNGSKQTFTGLSMKENPKSAHELTTVLKKYFIDRGINFTVSNNNIDLPQGFKNAKQKGSEYLITVDINQWQDVLYNMCRGAGIHKHQKASLDKADITIYVYNVETKTLLNKQHLYSMGCPAVFFGIIPLGMNNPEDRLAALLPQWATNIQ